MYNMTHVSTGVRTTLGGGVIQREVFQHLIGKWVSLSLSISISVRRYIMERQIMLWVVWGADSQQDSEEGEREKKVDFVCPKKFCPVFG
jgi:hypothetical protein